MLPMQIEPLDGNLNSCSITLDHFQNEFNEQNL